MSSVRAVRPNVRFTTGTVFLTAAVVAVALGVALAGDAAIAVKYFTRVTRGERPRLQIEAREPVGKITVTLRRDDGKVVKVSLGMLAAGTSGEVALPDDSGAHHYEGTLAVNQGGALHETQVSFDVVVADPLQIRVDKGRVNVDARTLRVELSRDPASADVVVRGAGGVTLAESNQDLTGRKAGEAIELAWPKAAGDVARIDIKVTDAYGYFAGVSLFPWSVSIPHEEVNFATDSADIAPSERPKLDASGKRIGDAIAQHRDLGPIKLYIAGHTDSQGTPAHNLDLSQRRARSIAGYFRKRGLRLPIWFEGFGEHAPLVATADETDEPRNRRVDYILAIDEPHLRPTGFAAHWKPIK